MAMLIIDGKEYLTTKEAGERLGGVSQSRVRHYVRDGLLTALADAKKPAGVRDTMVTAASVAKLAARPRAKSGRGRIPNRISE